MKFSIVVPVYNTEIYLRNCIDSILNQTVDIKGELEIILIDDGSTDSSGDICDEYKGKYPGIINVYHKKNEGLLATRRFGYKKAKGEYIVNCDSDDMLESDYFETIIKIINKYGNPDMILFNYFSFDDQKKEVGFKDIFTKDEDCSISKEEIYKKFLLHYAIVSVCAKVYKKKCIDLEKDYAEYGLKNNGEDTIQSVEFINTSSDFVYINKALYDYRGGSGMTAKFDNSFFQSFKPVLLVIEQQKDRWHLENFDELFSIKVFQTAGRAITQSRYKKWDTYSEHKNYLLQIRKDSLLCKNLAYLDTVKNSLQKSHYVCLKLLKNNQFLFLHVLLKLRSFI